MSHPVEGQPESEDLRVPGGYRGPASQGPLNPPTGGSAVQASRTEPDSGMLDALKSQHRFIATCSTCSVAFDLHLHGCPNAPCPLSTKPQGEAYTRQDEENDNSGRERSVDQGALQPSASVTTEGSQAAAVDHMVSRFLAWRLPENFSPDNGISFKAEFNEHTAHPMRCNPTGTNLFDRTQAEAMVRHMLEGLPK
jgi:hypothetical protein